MFAHYRRTQIIRRTVTAVLSAAFVTAAHAAVIPVGDNFFEAIPGPGATATGLDFSRDYITRGFFGPGSDAFGAFVLLKGDPIDPATLGTTDTIMHRPEAITVVDHGRQVTADLDFTALQLVTINPITVTYNQGQNPEPWNVRVSLQSQSEGGRMTIRQTSGIGGTYEALLTTRLLVTFTRVSDNATRQVPLGVLVGTGTIPWSFNANPILLTDGHFCPSCKAGESFTSVFSGPYLTLRLQPARHP